MNNTSRFLSPKVPGALMAETGREFTFDEDLIIQQLAAITYAKGDILYFDGSAIVKLGIGTNGQVLKVSTDVPAWNTDSSSGDVTGPASATADAIVLFNSTTGKIIKDSTKTIVTTLGADDTTVPTSKAVKDVTDALVTKATYDAHSVLYATTDNTPAALTITEQTVLGRATGGNISAIAIDSDLTSVSANDDTIPSAKATKTALDLKAPLASPTFTGTVTLPKTLEIQDTSADHQYVLAVSELTADRTITLPLLTGTDTFVFQAHTQTLTNKRITKRVASTANDATAVIDSDNYDEYYLTAMSAATEISVSGTPSTGDTIFIGLKDDGTTRALTWTGITGLGVTLPTTTTVSKQHVIGIKYIGGAWRAIAVNVEI